MKLTLNGALVRQTLYLFHYRGRMCNVHPFIWCGYDWQSETAFKMVDSM